MTNNQHSSQEQDRSNAKGLRKASTTEEPHVHVTQNVFERVAEAVSNWVTSTFGFASAVFIFVGWLVAGLFMGWEESWYYVDAGIAFATFTFVFLLQRTQRKDSMAIQTKLNELLAAVDRASPRLINMENQNEEEVSQLHEKYQDLREKDSGPHSIEECEEENKEST